MSKGRLRWVGGLEGWTGLKEVEMGWERLGWFRGGWDGLEGVVMG